MILISIAMVMLLLKGAFNFCLLLCGNNALKQNSLLIHGLLLAFTSIQRSKTDCLRVNA
jgi:hypothetical protein